ncbi:MAG: phosphoribosylformylglycinamidine synthase [Oscillospiraceae bacterium]|nr:phosphoribosylformylglycinamidine synthase [Oscillospiraceae bacterium]
MVYRVFTEKKSGYAIESEQVLRDLRDNLGIGTVTSVRVVNVYDVEGVSAAEFERAVPVIFAESAVDFTYDELPELQADEKFFVVEFLPGQFDQRADSAAQVLAVFCNSQTAEPYVACKKVYILKGGIGDSELAAIKNYLVNTTEARETTLDVKSPLKPAYGAADDVEILGGFVDLSLEELKGFLEKYSLAMDLDDIEFCRDYFKSENRNPTVTEIRMIDTYWSDHCRHTTFLTFIDDVQIEPDYIKKSYETYLQNKALLNRGDKPVTLMDIATAGMRKMKADGQIPDLDESEEINACSIKIKADIEGEIQDWLLMFKNETHNHPTEIEPFGGASTCLGGAIRDVLSGRAYPHQAMRITGSSSPLVPVAETIPGKLPPRKITTTAAFGYSSYGNQIGLPGGLAAEIYHDGYMAKRMELGALLGAAPAENVVRERPGDGDLVILLGGKTGRDGCGGATSSSKSHDSGSFEKGGAEVQKGNAPEERKIVRLFCNSEAAKLIKRCNDFGAGGVSVAIGELADGLFIDLDKVPVKYGGMDGTELAISESQERMAVVIDKNDAAKFIAFAEAENLEAVAVAEVRAEPRLKMTWRGKIIVDLSREFLNSNGADKHTKIRVTTPQKLTREIVKENLSLVSQRGLVAHFDSSAGGGTVLMPLGGKTQKTPVQAMAAKLPALSLIGKNTKTASLMAYGYNPLVSEQSPYHGGLFAVVESVAKVVAAGGKSGNIRLTFQEYFEKPKDQPERWGKPFAALLGAYEAQLGLGLPSIGGKDSMSGSFAYGDKEINVPPTLVSFAVTTANADKIISPEFKAPGNKILLIVPDYDENNLPDFASLRQVFAAVEGEIERGNVGSAWAIADGGVPDGLFKMSLGNRVGVKLNVADDRLNKLCYGGFILEAGEEFDGATCIGETVAEYNFAEGESISEGFLEPIFPTKTEFDAYAAPVEITCKTPNTAACAPANRTAKPRVLIPVFPGTSGEFEMRYAFEQVGAVANIFVMQSRSAAAIAESYSEFARLAKSCNILALPGGLVVGDEPDGAAKYLSAFFENSRVREAISELLNVKDGLVIGIGGGFNALVKTGLLPFGEFREASAESPLLTYNKIGRFQSQFVYTRIASTMSPWLSFCEVGEIYAAPFASNFGRFTVTEELAKKLIVNGQIFAQYADLDGRVSMKTAFNPAGSVCAVEGLLSPDGRVLGKMAHVERITENVAKNIPGDKDMGLFAAGVGYFR